ncbi:FAD-dependent pyridine nucleotide-disulfide oxidoreductase [Burkholderia arboris]|uniref:FAD-dependent pyridine nucleotide-disulfide oxidoreductase n=1 Tax=Burkholderia arboris TaxID=488730 RepID=A0A9Q9UQ41_9BURK|nr:FAD-dependent oxidoreductase [Burkholderia arboris]VWB51584.1 FAD-dependent pyridine nucleotide-disulfide oxidoreductase [Burkholderia arboris]
MNANATSGNPRDPVVIVGTGLAGYTVAREWRKLDGDTPLVMISRDDGRFYSKPALSNALAQRKTPDQLAMADARTMADQLRATIRTQCAVRRIDSTKHEIVLDDGDVQRYRALVLATGADARRVRCEGEGADDVLSINDLADYARFRGGLRDCRSVAMLGAGLIGCEFANDLVAAGLTVTVIDPADAPLSRLLPAEAGRVFGQALSDAGVQLRLGTVVQSIARLARGYRLALTDGGQVEADLVISAVGLAPRIALARDAGLDVADGIVTDAWCRTSAPDIFALGDCAAIDGRVRPYVLPIMHAARALAQCLHGTPTRVAFPVMPIVVKTPAIPAVVVAADGGGRWTTEVGIGDAPHATRALCADPDSGRITGFALLDAATAEKAALLKTMAGDAAN